MKDYTKIAEWSDKEIQAEIAKNSKSIANSLAALAWIAGICFAYMIYLRIQLENAFG